MGPIRGHARASQSVSDEIINAHGRDVLFPDSSCTQPVVMGACAHGCSHGRSRPQGRPRALGNCMEILMRDAEGHLESRLSIRGGTVIATLLPTTQTQPSGHSSISIFCVLPFLPSSIKIVLGDSCDWPDPVPWQLAMLRSIFDRRPARPCRESRPMDCKELEIPNCAQAISARAGKDVPARGPRMAAQWAADGSGRSVRSDCC